MANLKVLAQDTVIYGLSSIVPRFLNYLLVPLYTYTLKKCADYGVYNDLYSQTAILLIILTFGMETTFFRFINKEKGDKTTIYSTTLIMVGSVCLSFVALVLLFINPIASALGYPDHKWYIIVMYITVAQDAIQAIPFAYLRYQHRPIKFATLKLIFITLNISLNLIAFWLMPKINPTWEVNVGYAFAINLFCTSTISILMIRELMGFKWRFDKEKCRAMLAYTWPLLVLGAMGILNQVAGQILLPRVLETENGRHQLGIYGACLKVAMIMVVLNQAFRYAYEPMVFKNEEDRKNKELQSQAMKYLIIMLLLAFLFVTGYIHILKRLVGENYHEGLIIVPISMVAEMLMAISFNLSYWYKLIDQTWWGAIFSGAGCIALFTINFIFIPKYGYVACAWAALAAYTIVTLLSYFIGQKKNPIKYPLRDIGIYVAIATLFFVIMTWSNNHLSKWVAMGVNTVVLALFVAHIIHYDLPLSNLPVIGRYFKKS